MREEETRPRSLTRVTGTAAFCALWAAGAACAGAAFSSPAALSSQRAAVHRAVPSWQALPVLSSAHAPPRSRAGSQPVRPALHNDIERSSNWAGYAVQTTRVRRFTGVGGTWTVPRVTCARAGNRFASFWVGLDGYSSSSVEQLGTDSDCVDSVPAYYAWWEMYPAAAVGLSPSRFPVRPGDRITAHVIVTKHGYFVLTLTSSERWKFTHETKPGTSFRQSSAEWVAEAPTLGSSVAPLSHFSGFGFSSCTAATNGGHGSAISSFVAKGPHDLVMVNSGGLPEATPSSLRSDGHAFSVSWIRP